jgi:hypothetical protein
MPQQPSISQIEVALESAFATKKGPAKSVAPSAFQVSAKIDEQVRKENRLELSFLLTLADPKNMVTYEFRGTCAVAGSAPGFDQLMESRDGKSRLPRILDVIYQKVYPSVFLLAGMTSSPYPQSTVLGADLAESAQEAEAPTEQQAERQLQPEQKS